MLKRPIAWGAAVSILGVQAAPDGPCVIESCRVFDDLYCVNDIDASPEDLAYGVGSLNSGLKMCQDGDVIGGDIVSGAAATCNDGVYMGQLYETMECKTPIPDTERYIIEGECA